MDRVANDNRHVTLLHSARKQPLKNQTEFSEPSVQSHTSVCDQQTLSQVEQQPHEEHNSVCFGEQRERCASGGRINDCGQAIDVAINKS